MQFPFSEIALDSTDSVAGISDSKIYVNEAQTYQKQLEFLSLFVYIDIYVQDL